MDQFLQAFDTGLLPIKEMFADYQCAAMEIETKFKVLNQRFSIHYDGNPIESIKTRIKSPESIIKKMYKKQLPMNVQAIRDNLRDVAGIRVICSFQEDIYRLADAFLSQDDIFLVEKKDYIQNPKPSGYRSLHLIVQVPIFTEKGKKLMYAEVQLRTIAMDFWASLEHKLRYKKNLTEEQLEYLAAELRCSSDTCAALDRQMQDVYNELHPVQG
ncbi:MAG: GTP pyrophosphokinase family protein [Eubacteriales bacterium]|nr:GTP pyrophosphokinase family protein [Eubacteriales bacterium]